MLVPLIGRVSVDRVENEVILVIPSKKDWKIAFLAVWLAFWLTAPVPIVLGAVRSLGQPKTINLFNLLWSVLWAFGAVAAIWSIVWSIGGKELLRLTPRAVELVSSVFGLVFRRRATPSDEVRNLRFVPAYAAGRRSRESRISFEDANGTVGLAAGLEDAEALAVIEQMLAVYPFPKKDKALEYLDLNG